MKKDDDVDDNYDENEKKKNKNNVRCIEWLSFSRDEIMIPYFPHSFSLSPTYEVWTEIFAQTTLNMQHASGFEEWVIQPIIPFENTISNVSRVMYLFPTFFVDKTVISFFHHYSKKIAYFMSRAMSMCAIKHNEKTGAF